MRTPLMAGNWKMYKTAAETRAAIEKFWLHWWRTSQEADVVICAPFVNLPAAVEASQGTNIEIGGQDVFWPKEGAYTGEVSGRC